MSYLLRETASKNGGYYCINSLHSFRTKDRLNRVRICVKILSFII